MTFSPDRWTRFSPDDVPIYVRSEPPSWFVPNEAGDRALQALKNMGGEGASPENHRFFQRLPPGAGQGYCGRAPALEGAPLRELWFHVTDRCNLACTHCLFSSSPSEGAELSARALLGFAQEAYDAGARVFALTGGEPFVHREFDAIVEGLLALGGTEVVVLTNGMLLRDRLEGRNWPRERLHLQVSVDGLPARHDRIRGEGTFSALMDELTWLRREGWPFTLSMCVEAENVADMEAVVDLAADAGAANLHFMWYFVRGRGDEERFVPPDEIFPHLTAAARRAGAREMTIDNLEALKTQVFAPQGTIHDGSGSGWESVAVGPDGRLYPSAATVGIAELATEIDDSLIGALRSSPVLERLRRTTASGSDSPLRFLTGGGDFDHSYSHGGVFAGADPYLPLYERLILWLISQAVPRGAVAMDAPGLRLKMGDILESCGAHGAVALTHSNCLLAVARPSALATVKSFYSDAAQEVREDILNPVCYEESLISHIPPEFRFRGYGCGSPVLDANLAEGERVVDLGCGRGVECFVAARQVGSGGRVTGIDMLPPMLDLAHKGAEAVASGLGYDNLEFFQGYLEDLPLEAQSADAVLSNCVMNLSADKRRAFSEIFRVLKPGGRLVISDVVCESEPEASLRNDEVLRGECIAGALTQRDLVGILEESGFTEIRLLKRFPYRLVQGHPFFSLTFEARRPLPEPTVRAIYRGPFPAALTSSGRLLLPGSVTELPAGEGTRLGDQLFLLDEVGGVTNLEMENACSCALPPEDRGEKVMSTPAPLKHGSGCMACGAPLLYLEGEREMECVFCGQGHFSSAACEGGHFVCDACHSQDALAVIEQVCLQTAETDMITLVERIRRHPAIPVNGPEHHALVPGVILATYRNRGGELDDDLIRAGIRRGSQVVGGGCAFWGACGAAIGVGIAFSLILEANPLKPLERQQVQTATAQILGEIASQRAARCCQRDVWIALRKGAELSERLLPVALQAEGEIFCRQKSANGACQGNNCPLAAAGARKLRFQRVAGEA